MGSHQKLKRNEMKVSPISFLSFKNQKYCKFIVVLMQELFLMAMFETNHFKAVVSAYDIYSLLLDIIFHAMDFLRKLNG
jgi:hypothetical protein